MSEEVKDRIEDVRWYVIHTYSGYENKVKSDLEKTVEARGMGDRIFEIKVPKSVGYTIIMIWVLFLVRNVLKLNQDVYGLLLGVYGAARIFAIGYGVMTLLCILLLFRKRIFLLFVIIGMFLPYVQGAIAIIGVLDMIVDLRGIWLEVLKRGVVHGTSGEN